MPTSRTFPPVPEPAEALDLSDDAVTAGLVDVLTSTGDGWGVRGAGRTREFWPSRSSSHRGSDFRLWAIRRDQSAAPFGLAWQTPCATGELDVAGDTGALDIERATTTTTTCSTEARDAQRSFLDRVVATTSVRRFPYGMTLVGPDGELTLDASTRPTWAGRPFRIDRVWDADDPEAASALPAQGAFVRLEERGIITGSTGCTPITGLWGGRTWWVQDPGPAPATCPDDLRAQHRLLVEVSVPGPTPPTDPWDPSRPVTWQSPDASAGAEVILDPLFPRTLEWEVVFRTDDGRHDWTLASLAPLDLPSTVAGVEPAMFGVALVGTGHNPDLLSLGWATSCNSGSAQVEGTPADLGLGVVSSTAVPGLNSS